MAKRLIFLSGGVESTAMLTQANYNDIIVIVNIYIGVSNSATHHQNTEKIANALGYEVTFCDVKISEKSKEFVHQINFIMPMANIMCINDPEISEVWYGRNKNDSRHAQAEKAIAAWNILQPNVPWLHPLFHLNKYETWALIPDDIKPLVSSCIFHNNCGKCFKCEEFIEHVVKHLNSTSKADK